jgi:hypothetical protein
VPSPDATPYVDLSLFDKDPQDIFTDGLVNLQSYLPEWEPREGHTEVLLMESLALEVAQLVFAINRVPGAILEVLLRLYGVDRDPGAFPAGTATFTFVDDTGHNLPLGTRVAVSVPGLDDSMVFATITNVDVPEGQSDVTVPIVGTVSTAAANGLPATTPVELLDAVVSVEFVELAGPIGGGSGPEEDDEWFARGVNRFARLTETLVLPPHFVSAALERPEVERAFTVDNFDPDSGNPPGDDAGHVTVAVYGDGAPLTLAQKDAIEADFDTRVLANLAVHVVDPTLTPVAVTVEVVAAAGAEAATVEANVEAALTEYLSPSTWGWADTVYRNELISLIDRVDGVERVVAITTPAADMPLTGVAPLATVGALTVTVS